MCSYTMHIIGLDNSLVCSYTMHIIGLDISLVLLFCFSISDKLGGTQARDKN